jgi:hypothetical protein
MWWGNTPFLALILQTSHTYKMMWKPLWFDVFHTSDIELFRMRLKHSNTPEHVSLTSNRVYRTNISRISILWLNESQSLKFDQIQCVFESRQDVIGKTPFFGPNFANQSHMYKMMWKTRKFDAFHTFNIETFGTRFKRSNTREYTSLQPNKVYRRNISRTSLLWLNESQSLKFN